MSRFFAKPVTLLLAASLASSATAQTQPSAEPQSGGLMGSLGGLLGGGMPSVGSIGAGNAAGLLGYCLKNKLLGQGGALGALTGSQRAASPAATRASGAQSILQRLTNRQGVQTSPGFAAGQAGEIQAPNGQGLSLDDLGGQIKTQMCSLVLSRAKSFL
ncbi:MAG: DUF2501 domain-containing protein [Pseudomonadota bacterium]|jgi:hypothetical protein